MSARLFRAAWVLGALCAPAALVLLSAAGIAAAAGRSMGRPVTDPLSIATLQMPITTLTIQDVSGNAGPVFTDVGTTIDVRFDGIVEAGTFTGSIAPAAGDVVAQGRIWAQTALGSDATLDVTGDAAFNGGTGAVSVTGNVLIDGSTDVVQLTVQANATQTTLPFVVEDSAGTDLFTVSNAGNIANAGTLAASGQISGSRIILNSNVTLPAATNAYVQYNGTNGIFNVPDTMGFLFTENAVTHVSIAATGAVLLDGTDDVVQLTVQGNAAAQTTLPFVVENSAGTDQFTVSNAGTVTALGNYFGTGYVSFGGSSNFRISATDPDAIIWSGGLARAYFSPVQANRTDSDGQVGVGHISGSGGSTTGAAAGTGCGTSSLPTQSGNDIGGTLGATCGSAGTTGNPFVTITFADAYSTAPFCTIDAANAATKAGEVIGQHIAVTTTTTLAVNCGGGTCTTGSPLLWAYHCTQ
mgnify:CR=1 FL=1